MRHALVRLIAAAVLAGCGAVGAGLAALAAGPNDTWTPAGVLGERLTSPVFALAVDPADGRRVLAGTASGAIYLSADGGASWRSVRRGSGHAVLALAFDPARRDAILAGTSGAGIWRSGDAGQSWQSQPGTDSRTVRAFAFLDTAVLAAGDEGMLSSRDGGGQWSGAGLPQVRVSALAVLPAGARNGTVVAGGDATRGGDPLPLFSSADGGRTWAPVPVAVSGGVVGGSSMVAALAGGPAPRQGGGPLLVGTNTGLYVTRDQGGSWQKLTGGDVPDTDVSSLATAPRHADRVYIASDGGGSSQGGLWVSPDAGGHFSSLAAPVPGVTAVAVSGDDSPALIVATFRAADHAVALWTYRDTGGQPKGPAAAPSPRTARPAGGAAPASRGGFPLADVVARPETPYLVLGLAALALVVLAAVVSLRRGGHF